MTKLGKRQRAQVVELLRCAADWHPSMSKLVGFQPPPGSIGAVALSAKDAVQRDRSLPREVRHPILMEPGDLVEGLRWLYLEAAARVEEGSWP